VVCRNVVDGVVLTGKLNNRVVMLIAVVAVVKDIKLDGGIVEFEAEGLTLGSSERVNMLETVRDIVEGR